MPSRVSRRSLVISAAAVATAVAQDKPSAPPEPAASADQELQAAREQNRQIEQSLSRFDLKITTEPAVHFKALS